MSEALDIGALTDTLDADVLEQLAQTFEAELTRTRAALKEAALAGDRKMIRREVHSLSAIFAQLHGIEPTVISSHAILKPARHGAATPWHQDQAYWGGQHEHCSVSVWLPLQDTDVAGGCLHFVPGSHRLGGVEHRPIGDDERVHGLELTEPERWVHEPVAVPLRAGCCTVHHQRTLHHAPPNSSDEPRRALIMMRGLEPQPLAVPRVLPWLVRQDTAGSRRAASAGERS